MTSQDTRAGERLTTLMRTRPLTPDVLAYGLAAPSDPRVSPDGNRIAYTLQTVDADTKRPQSQVWLCEIDGSNQRPLTPSGEQASGARWSPDGRQLALTAARDGGHDIVVVAADGTGEARTITRHMRPIDDLAWSPDGARIAYTTIYDPENPAEMRPLPGAAPKVRVTRRLDYKQDGRGFVGDTRGQVFVVDVAGGERRRLTSEPSDHHAPQWSPDGQWLAVDAARSGRLGSNLVLIGVESGETKPAGPDGCIVQHWAWSPNGNRIVLAGELGSRFQSDYFLYDVASGESRRLTENVPSLPTSGFGARSQPVWVSEREVIFQTVRAAASQLEMLDVETGRLEVVQRWDARHSGLSGDRAARYFVQRQASFSSAGEIVVYDRETASARTITAYSAPVLEERPSARWERLEVERGEFTIEAWLLLPPDFDPAKRYPLILDVHGGPNANYGYGFMAHQQCLATHGFLLVYANPRGSTSYGGHFARQVLGDWGGEDYRDLLAVVDAVLARPYADSKRTGIFGFSYGGYMTAWAIGQHDRFAAAVCGEPFFDLESAYGTSMNGQGIAANAGGPPHERRDWFTVHSPSTFAHQTRTPTLIVQGEADDTCPVGQSEQMFVALKKAGCEVEFVRYPDGSHMFFELGFPEHRADFLARTLAWFKDHLGDPE